MYSLHQRKIKVDVGINVREIKKNIFAEYKKNKKPGCEDLLLVYNVQLSSIQLRRSLLDLITQTL